MNLHDILLLISPVVIVLGATFGAGRSGWRWLAHQQQLALGEILTQIADVNAAIAQLKAADGQHSAEIATVEVKLAELRGMVVGLQGRQP